MSPLRAPRDLSLSGLFTAGLVGLANAYTQPKGEPNGNPISLPGLNSILPVGKPYTITWTPTTDGTVTLLLLDGPATNLVTVYAIAEEIPNNGSHTWIPATDLTPGPTAATGYGIQLIDDANGQYQYTTQFGISNTDHNSHSESSSTSAGASATGAPKHSTEHASGHVTATVHTTVFTTYCPEATTLTTLNQTFFVPQATTLTITGVVAGPAPTHTGAAPTGHLPSNSSSIYSTGKPSAHTTQQPSTSTAMVTESITTTSASSTTQETSSASSSVSASAHTGGAVAMATGVAGLIAAAGFAVFAI